MMDIGGRSTCGADLGGASDVYCRRRLLYTCWGETLKGEVDDDIILQD